MLEKFVNICRANELTKHQVKTLAKEAEVHSLKSTNQKNDKQKSQQGQAANQHKNYHQG